MNVDYQQAFDFIAGKVEEELVKSGYTRQKVSSEDSNELWIGHRERFNEKAPKDPSILLPETAAIISYPGGHVEGFPDTFKHNFKSIYKAIENGDLGKRESASFEDGLREMLLCDAIVKSAKERRWVEVGE